MQETASNIRLKNTPINSGEIYTVPIKPSVIQIIFSLHEEIHFLMGPERSISLAPYSSYLFYEQNREFNLPTQVSTASQIIQLEIPIKSLHTLVSKGMDELNFSNSDLFEKERYHKLSENSEAITTCLKEIQQLNNPLMLEAKKFELLSLYFSEQDVQTYKCPFLNQKENVLKVRSAKELLIKDLQHSPTIKELSKQVGLNEYNLKTGFKEIYAKPIHSFLKEYKMNTAKELIDSRAYKINEIAEKMGYTNVSHFIDAFKRKFGMTPKQYELGR